MWLSGLRGSVPHCVRDLLDCSRYLPMGVGGARREGARAGQRCHMDGAGDLYGFAGADYLSSCPAKREFDSVCLLRKQADASERKMPTLRERLKRPEIYLAAVA